jgi:murein L,D-transpeptidase YcbB/YkuD
MGRKNIKQLLFMLEDTHIANNKKEAIYARLDIMLTNSFVTLLRFVVQGDVDWSLLQEKMSKLKQSDDIASKWEIKPKKFPNIDSVYRSIRDGSITSYLNTLLPLESRYRRLIEMLRAYRTMAKFPKVTYTNEIFKLGDSNKKIIDIKKRLQISGDLPQSATIDSRFDNELQKAVITYQKRYNLKVDGRVDKVMSYYLNFPAKKNIQQIIVNLDKCKLYPKRFESEYIEVNIPDFNLRYYRDNRRVFKIGVVVGRMDRPTPIFSDRLTYVVLNPTWTIPDNLIKRDLIHTFRDNSNYLIENNIHVFRGQDRVEVTSEELEEYEGSSQRVPYRFVQYPGDNNALGRIKFMFPNKYAVYIHDTDNKSLLERRYKIYSSGCIRVDKPFELLSLIMPNLQKERVDSILDTLEPTTLKLSTSIPVHILYFTVYQEDGLSYFKNDIYLYDQMIWESSKGHKKSTFTLPQKRFIDVKRGSNKSKNTTIPDKALSDRDIDLF